MSAEIWKPVRGHEGAYEVSDHGRVKSLGRTVWRKVGKGSAPDRPLPVYHAGRVLRPGRSSNGYLTVHLGGKSVPVQWLVAEAFIGPRPEGLLVLHGDGDRQNNRPQNLRYGTSLENAADKAAHGRETRGSQYRSAKLHEWTAGVIRSLKGFWSQSELAMLFGVSPAAVQAVHDGRTWRHAPAVDQGTALEWFWSFGPAGAEPITEDLKWNARRELDRRRAAP